MKKYWKNTLGQTGIIVFFITCLILLGISFFYNWLYIVSIPLTLFFIYSFNKDYSETMERVRRNEKSKSEEDSNFSENIHNNNLDSELQNDFPVKKAIENYFIERPNIARIFDELNMFLYKGFSAEKYLIETGIINSDDTRRIVSQGFYDISLYLETLEKNVNTLNRRDLSISEEFKKRYGKEVPEGSGIDSILFALHPEIKTSLKQAIEMLNKDGDLKPRPSKSNKLEKEIDDLYDSMFKKIKSFDRDEDLEYWYKINLESVDNPISVNARENRGYSLEQEMLEFLWGHNEEYELKMQGYSQDDKEEFIGMRIISFGALLIFYNELIEKINSISKRENIDLSEKINRLELETIHCKARLYGSIKFALTSNISNNKIKEWYDEFDDNNDLYIGLNPMDY